MRRRHIIQMAIIEMIFLYLAITRPDVGEIMFMEFGVLMLISILIHIEK